MELSLTTLEVSLKNPLESRLGYQLRRASVAMMADLAARLADLSLTITEASILILIVANPAVIQTEIGKALGIKRANMVPLVASLISRDWITREQADGRSHALRITNAGAQITKDAQRIMQKHEAHFFRNLPDGERTLLLARLGAVWVDREA
jgi:DNA-binding MarR family transcriptional regulator